MSGSPPRKWADYIEKIWDEYDAKPKLVVDLACGSGRVTRELAKRGRDMIGVDSSTEMLSEARRKKSPKDARILYLCQDMRELDLYGTSDSIVCLCDSINYIVDRGDLSRVFGLVRTFLNPGGIFVFDINSVYKYERVLKNNSFSGVYDDAAYIWENNYDKKTGLNEYYVTFFVKFGDKYERFDERHIQKRTKRMKSPFCSLAPGFLTYGATARLN